MSLGQKCPRYPQYYQGCSRPALVGPRFIRHGERAQTQTFESGHFGSSTSRGVDQKVRYVPRNQGHQTILVEYPGILPGYPGVPEKFEKRKFVFNSRPLKKRAVLKNERTQPYSAEGFSGLALVLPCRSQKSGLLIGPSRGRGGLCVPLKCGASGLLLFKFSASTIG